MPWDCRTQKVRLDGIILTMKQLLWNNPTFESFTLQSNKVSNVELSPLVKSTIFDDGKINILLIAFFDVCQSLYLFGILMYLITEKKQVLENYCHFC